VEKEIEETVILLALVYIVVIVSANGTEDRGFEVRIQAGYKVLRIFTLQFYSLSLYAHCYCLYWSEISVKKPIF
jgi:hypothetical protein